MKFTLLPTQIKSVQSHEMEIKIKKSGVNLYFPSFYWNSYLWNKLLICTSFFLPPSSSHSLEDPGTSDPEESRDEPSTFQESYNDINVDHLLNNFQLVGQSN